jgi:hypothetical protein
MRAMVLLVSAVALPTTLAAQTPTAVPKPGPEHKQLESFVGKWTYEGQAEASPYGPAGKVTSVEAFEWLPGGFFLSHHYDVRQAGVEFKGIEILGYDGRSKGYTTHAFDNFGNSSSWKATVKGSAWSWTGDSEVGGKPLRERCTTTFTGPDAATVLCEYSTDGAKWLKNFESKGTRTK